MLYMLLLDDPPGPLGTQRRARARKRQGGVDGVHCESLAVVSVF